ncbi:MAG: Gfo/Idh/MocA family oxidoreductase [Clostridia bacterium]|nr:Gfo/Idh/MocA family oxidoreductase [Clostridia bacterium]
MKNENKRTVKVGIIGCGGIAKGKHLPSLSALGDVEIVAFCDIIIERAVECAKEFGVTNAAVYENYKDLLADPEIEVVHVCTPNRSHSFITVDALEAGKHVMCEKPMAINSAEAKKMLDAAERTGKKLTIGYQNRQTEEARALKTESEKGTFGEIYYAKATALRRRAVPTWGVFLNEYEQGGGPLIDIGTHSLDLTLWMMNNYKPKYCLGTSYHKLNGLKPEEQGNADAWGSWDPEKFTVEDSAFGFVVMENGATVIVEASWALNTVETREATTLICGTKAGGDTWDGARVNGVRNGETYCDNVTESAGVIEIKGDGSHTGDACLIEARQWIDAVKNNTDPCVLPHQAYTVTRILEGIYNSAKSGEMFRF